MSSLMGRLTEMKCSVNCLCHYVQAHILVSQMTHASISLYHCKLTAFAANGFSPFVSKNNTGLSELDSYFLWVSVAQNVCNNPLETLCVHNYRKYCRSKLNYKIIL